MIKSDIIQLNLWKLLRVWKYLVFWMEMISFLKKITAKKILDRQKKIKNDRIQWLLWCFVLSLSLRDNRKLKMKNYLIMNNSTIATKRLVFFFVILNVPKNRTKKINIIEPKYRKIMSSIFIYTHMTFV